jgi:hypothetical protein
MNDQIRAAVERLFSACLEVTAAGKHHAFCSFEAHVGWLEIMVYPVGVDYSGNHGPHRLLNERIAIDGWGVESAEDVARALQQIKNTTDRLYGLAAQERAA